MRPEQIMAWVNVGVQLISVIGMPAAQVIAFVRQSGASEADLVAIEAGWSGVIAQIEGRIKTLTPQA